MTVALRLDVLRISEFSQHHVPAFAATATDAAKIERLYTTIEALPAYPGDEMCPMDLGVPASALRTTGEPTGPVAPTPSA